MGEVDKTYGAAYIGVCASLVLYGVTNLQTFIYISNYPQDKTWDKLSVFWLWMLDTAHVVVSIYMMYWYLITNYGNPAELLVVHWTFEAMTVLNAIVLPSVQGLYTVRVCRLDATVHVAESRFPCKPISIATIITLLAGIASALTIAYEITRLKYFTNAFLPGTRWVTYYPLITATCVDAEIASALCYLLSRCRTGFQKTNTVVTWLTFYIVNTGFLTSICSLAAVIMLTVLPGTFAVMTFEFVLTKLYINSYLAMLNARTSLRTKGCNPDRPEEIVLSPRVMSRSLKASASGNAKHSKNHINDAVTASSRSQRAECSGAVTASERTSTSFTHHAEEALEAPKIASWEQSRGDVVWVGTSKDPSRL